MTFRHCAHSQPTRVPVTKGYYIYFPPPIYLGYIFLIVIAVVPRVPRGRCKQVEEYLRTPKPPIAMGLEHMAPNSVQTCITKTRVSSNNTDWAQMSWTFSCIFYANIIGVRWGCVPHSSFFFQVAAIYLHSNLCILALNPGVQRSENIETQVGSMYAKRFRSLGAFRHLTSLLNTPRYEQMGGGGVQMETCILAGHSQYSRGQNRPV